MLLLEKCWTRVSEITFSSDGKCPPHNPFMIFCTIPANTTHNPAFIPYIPKHGI
jgi:hypothetical protein